jgi:hypothetical protein
MFISLTWAIVGILALTLWYAYAGSHDVFHPLVLIAPMMVFMYAWMPLKLDEINGLAGFFQRDQLDFVQGINVCGVVCFAFGCLSVGCRVPAARPVTPNISPAALVVCGTVLGLIGVGAWAMSVVNGSGGDLTGYRGGWDDNGYVRDASLLVFPAVLLIMAAAMMQGLRAMHGVLMALFLAPAILEAAFSARRGPTFMIAVTVAMGWYMHRRKRPSLVITGAAGAALGLLMLFLVSNRQNIYLGSDRELTNDVTSIVETPDTGNEYIYGTGAILSSEQRDSFYWGWRYLAQILVRPIPSSMWPTKYEDFGVPELTRNAGTGEGFTETLGWQGANGSAPGLIADLWTEFHWMNLPVLFLLGVAYAGAWRKAEVEGGLWTAQYVIMAALSVYFVMQTMEAVIYRLLILSIPLRVAWRIARRTDTIRPLPGYWPGYEG